MQYRPEIDGLRAVAVVPVILFHAGFEAFSGGFVGVDVFFVISGYLITSIILSEMQAGTFSLASFYERRARRILPALFLVMLVCIPFAWALMLPSQLVDFAQSLVATTFFSSNILFAMEDGYFGAVNELKPLLHTWSLAVEEQYYIFFPLFMMLLFRFGVGKLSLATAAVMAASFVLMFVALNTPAIGTDDVFYLLPTRAWELLVGASCAMLLARRPVAGNTPLAALGAGMLLASIFVLDSSILYPSQYTLLPVLGTALIVLFARDGGMAPRILSHRLLVSIGLLSYSAYLWHQPILAFLRLGLPEDRLVLIQVVALALIFPLSWLSYRFVETPMRRSRAPVFGIRTFSLGAGALASAFAAFWIATQATSGFAFRYPAGDRPLVTIDFEAMGDYVNDRFNSRILAEFSGTGAQKVLVVGDSYGQDFVNLVFEAGRDANVSLSTFHIDGVCGNLFVDEAALAPFIESADRLRCATKGRYENPVLRQRLAEADYVFLVSSWKDWQVPFLGETIRRISETTDATIAVIGRKNFGEIDIPAWLEISPEERRRLRNVVTDQHLQTEALMLAANLPNFVDFQGIVCEDETRCPVFTPDGELISHDGNHLSKAGARYVGEKLLNASTLLARAFPL